MVLLISDRDIAQAQLGPAEVIEAVEDAYRQDGKGLAEETPRLEIKIKGKHLPHIAPGTTSVGQGMAYLEGSKVFVLSYTYHFEFHKYISMILDPETGETLAIIKRGREPFGARPQAITSGTLRTGAAAAIGAKHLAKKKIESVGVIGTGRIGRASLLCMAEVREFDVAYSHSGRRKDDEFAQLMEGLMGVDVVACDKPEEVVRRSDVLVTATYSQEPVVRGKWLREGAHISGMGADGPKKAENDAEVFRRADKIVIDSEKCLLIGEVAEPIKAGLLTKEDIHGKIGEVVAGLKPGRETKREITFFESDGTHIQSAAVVNLIYERVKEKGLGIENSEVSSFFVNPKIL
jgi:ornithine cyclodeaminase/alanine dehydrogenase-like protein (mu-crystallin family)